MARWHWIALAFLGLSWTGLGHAQGWGIDPSGDATQQEDTTEQEETQPEQDDDAPVQGDGWQRGPRPEKPEQAEPDENPPSTPAEPQAMHPHAAHWADAYISVMPVPGAYLQLTLEEQTLGGMVTDGRSTAQLEGALSDEDPTLATGTFTANGQAYPCEFRLAGDVLMVTAVQEEEAGTQQAFGEFRYQRVGGFTGVFHGQDQAAGAVLSGALADGQYAGLVSANGTVIPIQGQAQQDAQGATVVVGQVTDPQSRQPMNYTMTLQGDELSFALQAPNGQAVAFRYQRLVIDAEQMEQTPQGQSQHGEPLDPRLFGTWRNSANDRVMGGGLTFTSEIIMELNPNGRFVYRQGQMNVTTQSRSRDMGGDTPAVTGEWKAENGTLYYRNEQTQNQWQVSGQYSLSGAGDALVIRNGNSDPVYWER